MWKSDEKVKEGRGRWKSDDRGCRHRVRIRLNSISKEVAQGGEVGRHFGILHELLHLVRRKGARLIVVHLPEEVLQPGPALKTLAAAAKRAQTAEKRPRIEVVSSKEGIKRDASLIHWAYHLFSQRLSDVGLFHFTLLTSP